MNKTVELWALHRNGHSFPIELSLSAGRCQGEPFVIAIIRDITERQKQDKLRQVSKNTLNSILRVAPTGIGVVRERIITHINDRFCEMVGFSYEELLGNNSRMLYLSDEDFETVGQEKYAQIRKCGTGTVETRMKRKDGQIIDVVSMLFDFFFDDAALPAPIKVLIGRLQIPILKVAILDCDFFNQKKHPARRLLDSISRAAMGWGAGHGPPA